MVLVHRAREDYLSISEKYFENKTSINSNPYLCFHYMQNETAGMKLAVDAIVSGYSKHDGVSVLLIQRKYELFKNG